MKSEEDFIKEIAGDPFINDLKQLQIGVESARNAGASVPAKWLEDIDAAYQGLHRAINDEIDGLALSHSEANQLRAEAAILARRKAAALWLLSAPSLALLTAFEAGISVTAYVIPAIPLMFGLRSLISIIAREQEVKSASSPAEILDHMHTARAKADALQELRQGMQDIFIAKHPSLPDSTLAKPKTRDASPG